jgi:hypothetical protein
MTEAVSAKGYVIARYSEAIQIYYKKNTLISIDLTIPKNKKFNLCTLVDF